MNFILIIVLIIILIIIYLVRTYEDFSSDDSVLILTFVSKTCPHCVTFKDKEYPNIDEHFGSKHKLVYVDNIPDDYQKYAHDVTYVPTSIVINKNKKMVVNGPITVDSIEKTIKSN